MELLWAILVWCAFGLIAGAIARLLMPGRQAMGIGATMLLGIAGSLVGGFIAWLIWGGDPLQGSGFIFSILGAIILLAIFMSGSRRRHAT